MKVTISIDDLEERNIDLSSLKYNSPAAQELFWDMMDQAEIEFGFNTSDSQLAIEAIPDSGEGVVITITRIDEDGDFESIHKYIKNRFRKNDLRVKKKSHKILSSIMIYSFNDFEDICALGRKLMPQYTGDSSLYKYKDTYYMILARNNFSPDDTKAFEAILSDFGRKVSNVMFYDGLLNEHGTKIIEYNALEVINNYF
ncbi:MAG TPA: adaptor protein MecA [Clostridia bacterium]|nr:adaptor protein MecA [Clostridia bacterium]